jgi:hypothetical protein
MAPVDLGDAAPNLPSQRQPSLFPPSTPPLHELPAAALASEVAVVKRPPLGAPRSAVTGPGPGDVAGQPPSESIAAARPAPGSVRPGARPKRRPTAAAGSPVATAPAPTSSAPAARTTPSPSAQPDPVKATPPPVTRPAVEEPAPRPTEVASAVPAEQVAAPRVKQVPRSAIPEVTVERTVWHPLADRRVAVVALADRAESVELHEGDALGPLVVAEIEPTGVVFVHEGVELRRSVGSH